MAMAMLALSILPMVVGVDTGTGIGIIMETEEFGPKLWMCDNRKVIDDQIEDGRGNGKMIYAQKVELCEDQTAGSCSSAGSLLDPQPTTNADCTGAKIPGTWTEDQTAGSCSGAGSLLDPQPTTNADCTGAKIPGTWTKGATENWCDDQCNQFPDVSDCVSTCLRADTATDGKHKSAEYCPILKGPELIERSQNYAFEGEKIEWLVLAMDKNKIEEITDVFATIGSSQGEGNDVEVECVRLNGYAAPGEQLIPECNARISEEELDQFDDQTMAYYECTLTVETPESMEGEHFVTVEAMDASGLSATMDENEYWFFNPIIAVSVDGDVDFGIVRPGTISYSETLLIGNDAEAGSGVLLDMFISGTDFYDPSLSGARCVITNRLKLGNNYVSPGLEWTKNQKCDIGFGDTDDHLCYYATNGAYSTQTDPRRDSEGYVPIVYGDNFNTDFYNDAEIMQPIGPYYPGYQLGNVLAPGAEIALTFKLGLPEPCVGDFSEGDIFFWGEAI